MSASLPALSHEQKRTWLQLIRSENIGAHTFRKLVNHFGGAAAALNALPVVMQRKGKAPLRICSAQEAEREMQRIAALGGKLIALGEVEYPQTLRAIENPPPLITVLGNSAALHKPAVALVGARNASAASRKFTQQLARDLGEAGFTVVSGLARGIDTAAHQGSLNTGTLAVLAGGLDKLYPPENLELAANLQLHGALVTEMPLGWEPRAHDFPRRNRIIAGLSYGIVVVEAAPRSGSLITARLALELGREVMAVPGFPLDSRSEGTNKLLRDGATLITCADHVIEALQSSISNPQPALKPQAPVQLGLCEKDVPFYHTPHEQQAHVPLDYLIASWSDEGEKEDTEAFAQEIPHVRSCAEPATPRTQLLAALSSTPTMLDDIIRESGLDARTVQFLALELEMEGTLERASGGRLALKKG